MICLNASVAGRYKITRRGLLDGIGSRWGADVSIKSHGRDGIDMPQGQMQCCKHMRGMVSWTALAPEKGGDPRSGEDRQRNHASYVILPSEPISASRTHAQDIRENQNANATCSPENACTAHGYTAEDCRRTQRTETWSEAESHT